MNDYRAFFGELARPRLTGTPDNVRVRERLKAELERRGYVTLEHAFAFTAPGGLTRPAYVGGALVWVSASLAGWRGLGAPALQLAISVLAGGAVLLALGRMRATLRPATGINLIAVRPRARVHTWLAAHYDSKGQALSMLARIVGVGLAVLSVPGLLVLAAGEVPERSLRATGVGLACALPGLLGGVALLQNRATNRSSGAVDNATGLATVFAILDRLAPAAASVGVLFTDAEEYGLLGARALVRERPNLFAGAAVLNLDGIDDRGPTWCVQHRPGPRTLAVARALGARSARLLPVVVDGWAFAPAAVECATVMRGDWRTAAIVHTPADTLDRLALTGCELVAAAIVRGLAE